jgi:serine/threonine-protein kinase
VTVVQERRWPLDLRRAWDLLADTERFNRLAALDYAFTDAVGPGGARRRVGRLPFLGMKLGFVERRFDYEAPRRFHIVRDLEGPVRAEVEVRATLAPVEGGTGVRYALSLTPPSPLLVPVVRQVARQMSAQIGTALDALVAEAGAPERLVGVGNGRPVRELLKVVGGLQPARFGAVLRQALQREPLEALDRLHPLRRAARWGLGVDEAIDAFCAAQQAGALEVCFDLLCPACLGPAARRTTLPGTEETVHCASCAVAWGAEDPDAIGVSFRPALPDFGLVRRCLGSPVRTPHVQARARVTGAGVVTWALDLRPGVYLVRALGAATPTRLLVEPGARATAAEIDVVPASGGAPPTTRPAQLLLAPGPVQLALRTWGGGAAEVCLAARWRPPGLLTLSGLLARPAGAALLERVSGTADVVAGLRPMAVLAVEVFDGGEALLGQLAAALPSRSPERILHDDRLLLALWPLSDAAGAVRAAAALRGDLRFASALGTGPVVDLGPRGRPVGVGVDAARSALRSVVPGRTGVLPGCEADLGLPALGAGVQAGLPGAPGLLVAPEAAPLLPPAPVPEVPRFTVGTRIRDRYRLVRSLGEGAFGSVFLAEDELQGGEVALKLLAPRWLQDPTVLQQTCDEARLAARLDHPGVVAVRDFGHTVDGGLFLTMDVMVGEALDEQLLRRTRLPPGEVQQLALDVLDALAHVHERGLLHRDLKPANLIRGPDRTGLVDFGIALALDEVEWDPDAMVTGTLRFMAPEQIRNRPQDARSDLFSLGLVLFVCLTGALPTGAATGRDLVRARVREPAPPVQSRCGVAIPRGLASAIDRVLSLRPEQRFASAAEMAAAIRADEGLPAPGEFSEAETAELPGFEDQTERTDAPVALEDWETR